MNWTSIRNAVASVLGAIIAYAVGKGWIPAAQAEPLLVALLALGGVAYGWYTGRSVTLVSAAASLSNVQSINTTNDSKGGALADAVPSAKVQVAE